jgi:pyruvate,water dikinase
VNGAPYIQFHDDIASGTVLGGKASALHELSQYVIPEWFVVTPDARNSGDSDIECRIAEACERLDATGSTFAVRSSAAAEDGLDHSFAGQFESYLRVPKAEVAARVREVWDSASSQRVSIYSRERGLDTDIAMAVLVQRMIEPVCAGVAFALDPATGDTNVSISYVRGTAERLVGGEETGCLILVSDDGRVSHQSGDDETSGLVDDTLAKRIADLVRSVSQVRGRPQDIEWAWDGDRLYLLQARPITAVPIGELSVWDNSNIAESYAGVTTPLTFSFARRAYEEVYRTFCRVMGVSDRVIHQNDRVFRHMLGSLNGQVYYNLMNWYRLIAMLPGYRLNAPFMEQMMGVESALPAEAASLLREEASGGNRVVAALRLGRSLTTLAYRYMTLGRRIDSFNALLDRTMRQNDDPFQGRTAHELVDEYRSLELTLLTRWHAPILNDFFAMISVGLLRKLCDSVCEDGEGLHNALLLDVGDIVSVVPARRIGAMAERVREIGDPVLRALEAECVSDLACIDEWPDIRRDVDRYIHEFGDRCLQELKLETPTLRDDPTPLLRSIAAMARRSPISENPFEQSVPSDDRLRTQLQGKPMKRLIARFLVPQSRNRIRDRENLRFARTRVFGYVRRLFVALGERYTGLGLLKNPRDIFMLEVEEALGLATGVSTLLDPAGTVASRRERFEYQKQQPALPVRFETRGSVHPLRPIVRPPVPDDSEDSSELRGVGCCPGLVRGRARVVSDPVGAELAPGDILIAERTDPGWVMLFPAATAIAVQHGSVLSHTSIVARELGLPCVVAVPGLLSRVSDGDRLELDGSSGLLRILERGA